MMELDQIPKFTSEEEEREFWENNDSAQFIDWPSGQKRTLPKVKPSKKNADPEPELQ